MDIAFPIEDLLELGLLMGSCDMQLTFDEEAARLYLDDRLALAWSPEAASSMRRAIASREGFPSVFAHGSDHGFHYDFKDERAVAGARRTYRCQVSQPRRSHACILWRLTLSAEASRPSMDSSLTLASAAGWLTALHDRRELASMAPPASHARGEASGDAPRL